MHDEYIIITNVCAIIKAKFEMSFNIHFIIKVEIDINLIYRNLILYFAIKIIFK